MPSFAKYNLSFFLGSYLFINVVTITSLAVGLTPHKTGIKISQNTDSTAAHKAFNEAEKLRQQGTVESLKQAIAKYEVALGLYRAVGDKLGEALTLNNIGFAYSALGEQSRAVEYYTQALPLMRSSSYGGGSTRGGRNLSGESFVLTNIGTIYDSLDDKQKALAYYQQVLPLMQRMGEMNGEAQIFNNVALIYDSLGEKQKTLDYLNRALPIWRELGDRSGEAFTVNSIGVVYDSLGDKQQALKYYNQALTTSLAAGDRSKEAIALNNIGLVYNSLGEKQKALEYLNKALPLRRALGDRTGEAQTLNNIGLVYDDLGEKQQALTHYQQVLSIWREVKSRSGEALTLNNIALAYNDLGDKQKAIAYLQQALPLWRIVGHYSGEALTLKNIAFLERGRGNLSASLSQIEAAIKIAESLRTKVASPQLRASYFATVQDYYEFYIDLLMQLHQTNPSQGYASKALEASERSRARSLLDVLNEAGADIRNQDNLQGEFLVAQERKLQQQLSAKEQQRVQILSGEYTQAQKTAIETEITNLLTEYQNIQDQIRATSPRYAALTQPQPLTLSQIQQQVLDDNTLLLQYSLGEERSYLWAVTKKGITSYELPKRADIEALTKRFQQEELVPAHQRIRKSQNAKASLSLSKILLQPVAKLLGNQRLVIVADGALQYIPFAALPTPASTNAQDAREYLIVNHEIVSLPSASTLAVLRKETAHRKTPPKTVALIADPVFSVDDERLHTTVKSAQNQNSDVQALALSRAALEADVNLSRLTFTRTEAEAIIALLPQNQSKKVLDFAASRNLATSSELAQYQIVHFATHGILNSKNPELSGIVLSLFDQHGNPQNGFLRLHDIYNLNLPVELVVLSACQTGLGKEIKGEGLVGLTRGFMYAGAPRVVVSLWDVQDQATSELMKRFYQKMLTQKLKPAAALRAAQIEMLKEKQWKVPYYWAGFILQGEWN
ncbi:CHAT domain-containing protein [Tolypothrix sp. PCC 7910]|uniref:CHAT domain-containing protein n=1 Tax=Tolypothrix sp. PCC 7910 TaxID=2099387 RepID=UPI0014278708|nr:CHAT domain-containing protein [Tolypothrix sp. PCC 7910]QIR36107.1 CHAT domain-containing protein [Tolypothrix sp. PCC 7910]